MSTGNAEMEGRKLADLAHKHPSDASMAMSEELGNINHNHHGDMKYLKAVTDTYNKYKDPLDNLPQLAIVGDNGKNGPASIEDTGFGQAHGLEAPVKQKALATDSTPAQPAAASETKKPDETDGWVKSVGSFLWNLLPFSAAGCGTAPEVPPTRGIDGAGGAGGAGGADGGCSDGTGGGGAGGAGGGTHKKDCGTSSSSSGLPG